MTKIMTATKCQSCLPMGHSATRKTSTHLPRGCRWSLSVQLLHMMPATTARANSEDMSLKAMSGDLEHLLGETGHEKCILIGHSLGGRTSMHFALHKPQYIEELIVVDIPLNFDMGKRNGLIMFLE